MNVPQLVLGGGAAGGGKSATSAGSDCSGSCLVGKIFEPWLVVKR